jgi:hypothetical protein
LPCTLAQVSGSDFTTSSATLVDITGLTFAAAANTLYEVDAMLRVQNSTGNGLHFTVDYSAAGATGFFNTLGGVANGVFAGGANSLGTATTSNFASSASTDFSVWIKGIVVTGANTGNITIKIEQSISGTATVYIGSRLTVYKLTP